MKCYPIATVAEQSADFRRVLWTGRHAQLVIMTIPPGGEIGEETHEDTDQILTFVSGTGQAIVADQTHQIAQGDLVAVPAGTRHNFRNTGVNPLVLYTVYGPPEHADGVVHATKEEADAAEISDQNAGARNLEASDKDSQGYVSAVQAQSPSGSLGIGSLKGR
jgi:mannose-6-phosphate isomerase-like protein (cupin superfamily)